MPATKLCTNGHVNDVTWEYCPYCPAVEGAESTPLAPPGPAARPAVWPPVPEGPIPKTVVKQAERHTAFVEQARLEPPVGWLVVLSGTRGGRDFRLKPGRNVIGASDECDIQLTDQFVSSVHAHLNYREVNGEKQFVLVDMDSRNGCYLNDNPEPVAREELVDNDTVVFGEVRCRFKRL